MKDEKLNLASLLALTMSDIDIFLLQENPNKEHFSPEEIRTQLEKTMCKVLNVLKDCGFNIKKTLPLDYINPIMQSYKHKSQLKCDVCGSKDVIEAPHMGTNCNYCNPLYR